MRVFVWLEEATTIKSKGGSRIMPCRGGGGGGTYSFVYRVTDISKKIKECILRMSWLYL